MKRILCLFLILSIQMMGQISWTVDGRLNKTSILTTISHALPNGWHSYWKNPGDSGLPSNIVSLTDGVSFDDLIFPRPYVITTEPIITYGYEGTVNYKLPIKHLKPGQPLSAQFNWLECKEICLQKSKTISLLPYKTPLLSTHLPPIHSDQISIIKTKKNLIFKFNSPVKQADFFPYNQGIINIQSKQLTDTTLEYNITSKTIVSISGELYINDDESPFVVSQKNILTQSTNSSLLIILLTAFIGGLLLNIMPCVLPILGLKALQIQKYPTKRPIKDALYFGLGVLGSLWVLYTVFSLLKQSGLALGWGFQLQSPVMISMLIIFFLILCLINLDLIMIQLPKFISKSTTNHMVFSGIITTIVATPCTAPFLGSALYIALSESFLFGFTIFSFVGLGLAGPMILIIMNPKLHRFIPSSGRWNMRLKHSFSLAFMLTIGWLLWVLVAQIDQKLYLTILSGLSLLTIAMIRKSFRFGFTKGKTLILVLLLAFGLMVSQITTTSSDTWVNFHDVNLIELELNQQPYFIDVTAKWCVTCQSNKLVVLNKKQTKALFSDNEILLIRADWTNIDPKITELLQKFDQISIPTYIYFDGINHHVLTDILTYKELETIIQ